jgi:hypothetical protein
MTSAARFMSFSLPVRRVDESDLKQMSKKQLQQLVTVDFNAYKLKFISDTELND